MKRTVVKYGLISGVIISTLTAIMVPLAMTGRIDFGSSQLLGYSAMVLSFLAVFFGIRSYRDTTGGAITFGRAFKVGILITLVACAVYVIAWEIVYWGFLPDFADRYTAVVIEKLRESGASAAEVASEQKKMDEFKKLYRNPLFNVAVTFMEIFPVGLIVTLVSAGILRRKPGANVTASVAALA